MTILKTFRSMPIPILVMFIVFFVTPISSMAFIELPWNVFYQEGWLRGLLVAMAYWVLPLGLCYSLIFKHFLFLPLYGLQCLALFGHSVVYSNQLPLDMLMARYVLIAFMAYVGFFFGNKDFLYPFLVKDYRIWRKTRRVKVNYEIHLLGERPEHKIPARIRDCSVTGLAVTIDQRHVESFIKKKGSGERVTALIRWQGQERAIPAEIVWVTASDKTRFMGLRVAKNEGLEDFVNWVQEELVYEAKLLHASTPLLEHELHQTALTFWVLFIVLSFGLPAFAFL